MYQPLLEIYILDNVIEIETSSQAPSRYFHLILVFPSQSCWVTFMSDRQEYAQALETDIMGPTPYPATYQQDRP